MSDLHELNRSYLIILRDAIKTDRASACTRFNIDQCFAETLGNMSLKEISAAAETNQILFRPSVSGLSFGQMVTLGSQTARTVMSAMANCSLGSNGKALT